MYPSKSRKKQRLNLQTAQTEIEKTTGLIDAVISPVVEELDR